MATTTTTERSAVLRGAGAALVAAVVSGVLWGLIVKWSEYEVGFVAWAIGFIVGTAVAFAVAGRRGLPYQVVAVAGALLGIALGKYLSFALVIQDVAGEQGASIGLFSSDMFDLFSEELGTVFGWFDLLWVGLAVVTAWRILEPEEPEREPASTPAE